MVKYYKVEHTRFTVVAFVLVLNMVTMGMLSGCGSNGPFDISGTITSGGSPLPNVTVTLNGNSSGTVTTDGNGRYSFSLKNGQYTLTPSFPGYNFSPQSQPLNVYNAGSSEVNFVGTSVGMVATTLHTVYMNNLNQVYTWGYNNHGQLGIDPLLTPQRSTSALVGAITTVAAIAAGNEHTVTLKSDGTVWAWGNNSNGQLGNGNTPQGNYPIPIQVMVMTNSGNLTPLTGVIAVSAGYDYTVALTGAGTVWAWGSNSNGQLGNGSMVQSNYPTPIQVMADPVAQTYLTGVTAVSAGYDHTVALKSDGTVLAWGSNSNGQLGNGSMLQGNYPTPIQVMADPAAQTSLTGVIAVSAGYDHTVALKSDGTVLAWGSNSNGQLGNGSMLQGNYPTPIQVMADPAAQTPLTGVIAVSAGYDHTVALKSDGTVLAWGSNSNGQLGNGSTPQNMPQSNYPVPASGLSNIMYIAAGYKNTVARQKDGTIWAWGYNYYGQLGNGKTVDSSIPVNAPQPPQP